MINAINIALGGLQAASTKVDKAATDIAVNGSGGDLVNDAVNLALGGTEYKANVAVMKVASDMDKDLLHAFDQTV
jgi:hypothetical protein